jgi:anthranilate synthase component I
MQAVKSPTQPSRLGLVPTPSLDEVRDWLVTCDSRPSLIPIYREIMADSETPVSAYARIHADKPGFILESVEGGERIARYSFIGTDPFGQIRIADGRASVEINGESTTHDVDDPLAFLEAALARYQSQSAPGVQLPRFVGGAVGYLSYEAVRAFEPRVGLAAGPGLGYPDAHFMLVDSLLVFDNVSRTIKVVAHLNLDIHPDVESAYAAATGRIDELVAQLRKPMPVLPNGGEPVETSIEERRRVNTDPLVYRRMVETARSTSRPATSSRWCSPSESTSRLRLTHSPFTGRCGR